MKFVVQITKQDNTKYIEENFSSDERAIARDWARRALDMEGVVSAEVLKQWQPEDLAKFHKKYDEAVKEFGEQPTLHLLDNIVLSELPWKAKAARIEKHPGFQLLRPDQRRDIQSLYDEETILYLARLLLSALAVANGLKPISKNAPKSIWKNVLHELRALYHSSGEKKDIPRAVREARTQANRLERHASHPQKGRGKGGN